MDAYLVEDHPQLRESLKEALAELAGIHTAGEAATAAQAKAWLADPANRWDLAIVDLVLEGGGSGLDVLAQVRQRSADQRVVVLTATANGAVREQCRQLGADAVFDKAMETEAMFEWLARLSRR